MIQDPSKDVTLIVYNTPEPPHYLKVNKRLMRFILLVIPTLIIVFLGASFFYSIFLKNKVSELKSLEPAIKKQLVEQEKLYETQISDLQKSNASLTNKLSRGTVANETTSSLLSLFNIPLGMQDFRSKNQVSIRDIEVKAQGDKVLFSFFIQNETSSFLRGKITIIQYQGNLIQYYPNVELNEKNLRLEYAHGDSDASFGINNGVTKIGTFQKISGLSSRYKVFLFSNTGDLLLYQQLGPYNIE